jgi:hypothetical protein
LIFFFFFQRIGKVLALSSGSIIRGTIALKTNRKNNPEKFILAKGVYDEYS